MGSPAPLVNHMEEATFTPKMLAHPCRPVVTWRAVALLLVSRQAQCTYYQHGGL